MVQNWVNQSERGLPTNSITMNDNSIEAKKQSPQSIARRQYLSNRLVDPTDWFNSLAKMPSHYCRKRISRLYLEGPFNNLNEIFNLYKQHCAENNILAFSKCFFYKLHERTQFFNFHPKK